MESNRDAIERFQRGVSRTTVLNVLFYLSIAATLVIWVTVVRPAPKGPEDWSNLSMAPTLLLAMLLGIASAISLRITHRAGIATGAWQNKHRLLIIPSVVAGLMWMLLAVVIVMIVVA